MQTSSTVYSILPTLPDTELRKIGDKIKYLLHTSQQQESIQEEETKFDSLFYQLINQHLQSQGLTAMPYGVLRSRGLAQTYQKGMGQVEAYVQAHWPRIGRFQRIKLYHLMLKLMNKNIRAMGLPLTVKTIILQLPHIPTLVDQEFPDYLACGLQQFLLHK